jgi:hypothetical protein
MRSNTTSSFEAHRQDVVRRLEQLRQMCELGSEHTKWLCDPTPSGVLAKDQWEARVAHEIGWAHTNLAAVLEALPLMEVKLAGFTRMLLDLL